MPRRTLPTLPAAPVSLAPPVRTPTTVSGLFSGSVSLASTLPPGLMPASALFRPPASTALPSSGLAVGVSLRPKMMMCSSAWSLRAPRSVTS
ncbi:hypothetical protein D3C78_1002490 [compost metagenome]